MISLWFKLIYTLLVSAIVAIYLLQHRPAHFIWLPVTGLLVLVPALWLESPLLVSMLALAVVLPGLVWIADFIGRWVTGVSLLGLTDYMFDPGSPRPIRGLSLLHVALPVLLIWVLHRIGYDGRALFWQTIVMVVVLPFAYFLRAPRDNVDMVYSAGEQQQTAIAAQLFVLLLMLIFPLAIYLPMHLVLGSIFGPSDS